MGSSGKGKKRGTGPAAVAGPAAKQPPSWLESVDYFKFLDTSTTVGVGIIDLEGRFVYVNKRWAELLGYSEEEMLARTALSITHPGDIPETSAKHKELFSGRLKNYRLEKRLLRKDGGVVWANLFVSVLCGSDGRPVGVMGLFSDITDMKTAKLRIQESERKYRAIYESSADAVMLLMPGNKFAGGNAATIKMFGCRDENEFTGQTPSSLSPEYQPDGQLSAVKARNTMELALREGSHFFEWTHKTIDGRIFPATVLLTRVEIGGKTLLQATVRDITEQKRAEATIREYGQRLAVTLHSIADAVVSADPDGHIIMMNAVAGKLTGWAEKEAAGRHIGEVFRIIDEKSLKECDSPFNTVLRSGQAITAANHAVLVGRDGHGTAISYSCAPILNLENGIMGAVLVFRDVTEERRRQDINEKFRVMTEITSDWLWETDAGGFFLYSSPKAQNILGYEPGELPGKNLFGLMPSGEAERFRALVERHILCQREPLILLETILLHKDGHAVHVETSTVPIIAENGGPRGYRGIMRDITERRKKDEIMRMLEVDKRTMEAATKAKSAFLANMSHELRTPLNIIIASSSALATNMFGALGEKQAEYVNYIHTSGKHLLSLINDILDLTKIESGKMLLQPASFNIWNSIGATVDLLKEQMACSGIHFEQHLSLSRNAEITADERKIRQIIINLLSNAIKFTPRGGTVALEARMASSDELDGMRAVRLPDEPLPAVNSARYLLVSVRDTGIGIAREDMGRLFKPFAQVEANAARNYEGSGLGLVMVKKLVELHNGRLFAESEKGKGSVFSFALPADTPAPG
ncbi:MAG: PAS domain S-box protein [Elusimicrobiales bacterium]